MDNLPHLFQMSKNKQKEVGDGLLKNIGIAKNKQKEVGDGL